MSLPILDLSHIGSGILLCFLGLKIRQAYLRGEKKNPLLKYFMLIFFWVGAFQIFVGLPHLTLILGRPEMFPQLMVWGYIVGHICLFMSFAYTIMIPTQLYWPRAQRFSFAGVLLFGLIIIVLLVITPFQPIFKEGITLFNPPPLVAKLIPLLTTISWGPTALVFLYNAIKGELEKPLKVRSVLLGIGFILMLAAGPMHNIAQTVAFWALIEALTVAGFLIIAAAILFYSKPEIA